LSTSTFQHVSLIVDVYVRHLLANVDEPHRQKLIRTVRGVGYSMSEEAGT
jgi:DNA-binding response OmpR family regulator